MRNSVDSKCPFPLSHPSPTVFPLSPLSPPPPSLRLSLLSLHPPLSPLSPPSFHSPPSLPSSFHSLTASKQSQQQVVTQDTHPLCHVQTLHSLHKKAIAARPLASLTPPPPFLLSPTSFSSRPLIFSPCPLGCLRGTERVRKGAEGVLTAVSRHNPRELQVK